jgi:hypothetical protein
MIAPERRDYLVGFWMYCPPHFQHAVDELRPTSKRKLRKL